MEEGSAMRRVVVVGGSLAGHRAAASLRELGYVGDVTVVGAEVHAPYDRYPLSKDFLTGVLGRPGLDLSPGPADIHWRVGQAASGLDLAGRAVILQSGERLPFDGLVVATGARARQLPGTGEVPEGVFGMRTVEDSIALQAALSGGPLRLVVVGGGLIGAEIASVARAEGHHVTLVDSSHAPSAHALGRSVAAYLVQRHRERGVRLRAGERVERLVVESGRVVGVTLRGGDRLPADVVVVAAGTQPSIEWLEGSGLVLDGGLVCSATLHALGGERVVAAGDVLRAPHPVLGGDLVRVEHWASTRDQARLAVENLLVGPAAGRPYTSVPEFGSTIHDVRIRSLGFPKAADTDLVVWGSVEDGEAVVALGRGGRLVGAVSVNATPRLAALRPPLESGARLDDLACSTG
jgi:3-phenylpropionate/trans-cinnamate dioxygenase ferredoxin reductase component